jgi:uncharacterized membrane protein YeaQ/YmgE (transglycosylase-associated protein family)
MGALAFILVGLIAGLIARFLVPGRQSMGIVATLALGMLGSFIGGMLSSLFATHGRLLELAPAGIIGSTIGAFLLLLAVSWSSGPRVLR